MAELSRKHRRGNSVVKSVEDIVNEVATLREEVKRVKNDNECLTNDNKRLAYENTGLQADISELKKLDTIRGREMLDLEKEKEKLAKRVSDGDIDVYEQANLIEELQGKLKAYDTDREGRPPGENADTSGTNTPKQSQPISNKETVTASIRTNEPSQTATFSDRISSDDHVADAAEIEEQIRADITWAGSSILEVNQFHSRQLYKSQQELVYGRSRRELFLSLSAIIGTRLGVTLPLSIPLFSELMKRSSLAGQMRLARLAMKNPEVEWLQLLLKIQEKSDQLVRACLIAFIMKFGF